MNTTTSTSIDYPDHPPMLPDVAPPVSSSSDDTVPPVDVITAGIVKNPMPDVSEIGKAISAAFKYQASQKRKDGRFALSGFLDHLPDFELLADEIIFVDTHGRARRGIDIDDRLSMKNLTVMFAKGKYDEEAIRERIEGETLRRWAMRTMNDVVFEKFGKAISEFVGTTMKQIEIERPLSSLASAVMTHDR